MRYIVEKVLTSVGPNATFVYRVYSISESGQRTLLRDIKP